MSLCRPKLNDRDNTYVCEVCGWGPENGRFVRECSPFVVVYRPPAAAEVKRLEEPPPSDGPGTELKRLLKWFGITAKGGCRCNARAAFMDRNGPEWCASHIDVIVGWMEKEAKRRKLPFVRFAARMLVKLAIHRAVRRQARADPPASLSDAGPGQ